MAKDKEYFKAMKRSEKDIEKRLLKGIHLHPDIELLEDKIIQLEKREEELMNEINRLKSGKGKDKGDLFVSNSYYQQAIGSVDWSAGYDQTVASGELAQPTLRARR